MAQLLLLAIIYNVVFIYMIYNTLSKLLIAIKSKGQLGITCQILATIVMSDVIIEFTNPDAIE